MNNKLEIKYRGQKQSFEILDNEILVDMRTTKHKLQYRVPLEEIKNQQYICKNKHDGFTVLAYLSFYFNLALIIYLFIDFSKTPKESATTLFISAVIIPVIFLKSYFSDFDEKHIESSKILYFIYTKKLAPKIDAFIELIYQKQKDFYRSNYFKIDPVLPYPIQYERYLWLYSNKYINENEYDLIKEELDKYTNFNPTI